MATGDAPAMAKVAPLADCPPPQVVCPATSSPVYCTATTYNDRRFPATVAPVAWGSNECRGRLALAEDVCAHDLKPSRLSGISCVPDASGGQCPGKPAVCTMEVAPSVCTASQYGDQPLTGDLVLKGWGSNPCRARADLEGSACRRNLNPKLLGKIDCAVDPTGGECPPRETLCQEPRVKARCQVTRWRAGVPARPLEATGESACEAKQALARLACREGRRPGDFDEVVCRFEH
jgi:hypothetical protein